VRPRHQKASQGIVPLAIVEAALQRAVRLSSSAQAACTQLEGTMVALHCEDLNRTIHLHAGAHGARLLPGDPMNTPGLRLSGTIPAIMATLYGSRHIPKAHWTGDPQALQALRCLALAAARQGLGWPLDLDGVLWRAVGHGADSLRGAARRLLRQVAEAGTWELKWFATPTQAAVSGQRLAILERQLQDMRAVQTGATKPV
jgi:hypothetical protein